MRIGMEHPVQHHLLEDRAEQRTRQLPTIELPLVELRTRRTQRRSLQAGEDEDARGRQVLVHRRQHDALVAAAVARGSAHGGDVAGLDLEVELFPQRLGEALRERHRAERTAPRGSAFQRAGQPDDDVEVPLDDQPDVRPLHLHHDVLPGLQPRPVDLRDGGRRQRRGAELGEHLARSRVQLAGQDCLDLVPRRRRDLVLQLAQLLDELDRQHVAPCRQHLAELDERHAALFERQPQGLREPRLGLPALALRRVAPAAEVRPETVPERDQGDLRVPACPPERAPEPADPHQRRQPQPARGRSLERDEEDHRDQQAETHRDREHADPRRVDALGVEVPRELEQRVRHQQADDARDHAAEEADLDAQQPPGGE
jgi:hypothetical protein